MGRSLGPATYITFDNKLRFRREGGKSRKINASVARPGRRKPLSSHRPCDCPMPAPTCLPPCRLPIPHPRIYVDAPLGGAKKVALDRDRANYLLNAIFEKRGRAGPASSNGRDGEWQAKSLVATGKRALTADARRRRQCRSIPCSRSLQSLRSALCESRRSPNAVARLNLERMRANVGRAPAVRH